MVNAATKEQEAKRKFWKGHIDECGRSGRTQAEYCRRHKLSVKSFTYWKSKFRGLKTLNPAPGQKKAVTFVAVEVKRETRLADNNSSALVLCKDGYRIEINEGFKAEALGEVLRTLRALSC